MLSRTIREGGVIRVSLDNGALHVEYSDHAPEPASV